MSPSHIFLAGSLSKVAASSSSAGCFSAESLFRCRYAALSSCRVLSVNAPDPEKEAHIAAPFLSHSMCHRSSLSAGNGNMVPKHGAVSRPPNEVFAFDQTSFFCHKCRRMSARQWAKSRSTDSVQTSNAVSMPYAIVNQIIYAASLPFFLSSSSPEHNSATISWQQRVLVGTGMRPFLDSNIMRRAGG